jgi:hypothetical protein
MGTVVTGAPYSGEQVSERVQTLADGTHITSKFASIRVYRDSVSRTRTERHIFASASDSAVIVEIIDPVAQVKYTYTLDAIDKMAHRQRLPSPAASLAKSAIGTTAVRSGVMGGSISATGVTTATASGDAIGKVTPSPVENRPQMSNEKLGIRTIEGVLAEGTRRTVTYPADFMGNDRPVSAVTETWTAPDLKVQVMISQNDPRLGENTQKIINISRDEPSASLFQPAPEYTVVDEEGDFTIKWGSQ